MADVPMNPCAFLGLSIAEGAELISGILTTQKGIYVMAVLSSWAALNLGWVNWFFSRNPDYIMKNIYENILWFVCDSALAFGADWILLVGIRRKSRTMCYAWMCTFVVAAFRFVFLGPQQNPSSLLATVVVGAYEYLVIWAYSEDLKRQELMGVVVPEPMPFPVNTICIVVVILEVVFTLFDSIIGYPPSIVYFKDISTSSTDSQLKIN